MYSELKTPVFVCHEDKLRENLEILHDIKKQSKAKILLALKAFSMYSTFDLVAKYLDGACASGLNEARLAHEYMKKEVHAYSPALSDDDAKSLAKICSHVVLNSNAQVIRHQKTLKKCSLGLRCNLETGFSAHEIYNPCAPFSRLGVRAKDIDRQVLKHVDGLHFHALCEQNVDALSQSLDVFLSKFSKYLKNMKWVNFGGGHHITKPYYNRKGLVDLIKDFKKTYKHLDVYLEPGEAVALDAGVLVARVLDIVENEVHIAILDVSAEAHMIDSVIMPYTPEVRGASVNEDLGFNYTLAGNTCLAGDVIGHYSFAKPLKIGDVVVFEDMLHYTMVKTTTFNGINLPSIAIEKKGGAKVIKAFGYEDFKSRL